MEGHWALDTMVLVFPALIAKSAVASTLLAKIDASISIYVCHVKAASLVYLCK
jgi:hypothetical protein